VHEHIKVELIKGEVPRNRYFFPDEQIKEKHFQVDQSFYAETEAFKRFNINRGHMAAAGNYSNS
jgi:DNA/RNA endonuclease G (NUC1)